jgi:hypothetical protein
LRNRILRFSTLFSISQPLQGNLRIVNFGEAGNTSRIDQKINQLSGNLHDIGDNILVVFNVFENSDPSREVYVDFGLVKTVND